MVELQAHSTFSDGELEPAQVVAHAAASGVTVLALTDHDQVAGVPAARQAADEHNIRFFDAVELSSTHQDADDLHVLGYGIDLEVMRQVCDRAQDERVRRAEQMVAKLQAAGVDVQFETVTELAGGAASIGRPHIARAAGADRSPQAWQDFFDRYLTPGCETFVARTWPTTAEAVDLIHQAGGVACFAHPFLGVSPADVLDLIRELPWQGVEVFYPQHSRTQTSWLLGLCQDLGLRALASSDFHGPNHKRSNRFGDYDTYELGVPQLPF